SLTSRGVFARAARGVIRASRVIGFWSSVPRAASRGLRAFRGDLPRCLAAEVHRTAERIAHDLRLHCYQNLLRLCGNGVAVGEILALDRTLERERLAR